MKKQLTIIISTILVMALSGCSGNDSSKENKTSIKESVTETPTPTTTIAEQTEEPQVDIEADLPDDFNVATNTELASLPDTDVIADAITDIFLDIGVTGLNGNAIYGNYEDESIEDIEMLYIDAFTTTDTGKHLITSFMYAKTGYSSGEWSVLGIIDADTKNCYYTKEDLIDYIDLYDYKSGNIKSEKSKTWDEFNPVEKYKQKIDEMNNDYENKLNELKEKYNLQ